MKRFEVGKTYEVQDHCNPSILWSFTVEERTERLMTLSSKTKQGEKRDERMILRSGYYDAEVCMPLGSYPLCPMIVAGKDEA